MQISDLIDNQFVKLYIYILHGFYINSDKQSDTYQ